MTRERDESGRYVETVGESDVLAVFDRVDGPVITSSDVSDALDCTTEAARQKLARLVDAGTLSKRKTGHLVVYWRADPGPQAETTDDSDADDAPLDDSAPYDPTDEFE
jgi:hypothetical protein